MPELPVLPARLDVWSMTEITLMSLEAADIHHALAASTGGTWTTKITPVKKENVNFMEFPEHFGDAPAASEN